MNDRRSQDKGQQLGVVVLGMHRSGTSALAHLLGELGCDFGGEILGARTDNPLGYWEHADVVRVHDDFLAAFDRTWDDPRPLGPEHFHSDKAQEARHQLSEIFERDFVSQSLWVLKDPRLCRLLPLWDEILTGAEIRFVHIYRHPLAVAGSLSRRDGMGVEQSCFLWLRHIVEAEKWTRGRRCGWLAFEDLMADPSKIIKQLCDRIDPDGLLQLANEGVFERVLKPSEVHHRAPGDETSLSEIHPWVDRLYRALGQLAGKEGKAPEAFEEIDHLAAEFAAAERLIYEGLLVPVERSLWDGSTDRRQLRQQAKESERFICSLEEVLERKEKELEEAGRDYRSLEEALERKDHEYEEASSHYRSLEETLASKEGELEEARSHYRSLEETLASKEGELEEARSHYRSLEERLASKEGELEKAGRHYHSMEQVLERKDRELEEAARHASLLQEALQRGQGK